MNTEHIKNSLQQAELLTSKLNDDVLKIDGMSGLKNRHLLNNLLNYTVGLNFLEIGSWKGSTACSALYKNTFEYALLIDDFSEFDEKKEIKEILTKNIKHFAPKSLFIEDRYQHIDFNKHPKFDIFHYDGSHDYENQKNHIQYIYPHLNNTFLYIADDYYFDIVKTAIKDMITDMKDKINILYETFTAKIDPIEKNWWYGQYIILCQKK